MGVAHYRQRCLILSWKMYTNTVLSGRGSSDECHMQAINILQATVVHVATVFVQFQRTRFF